MHRIRDAQTAQKIPIDPMYSTIVRCTTITMYWSTCSCIYEYGLYGSPPLPINTAYRLQLYCTKCWTTVVLILANGISAPVRSMKINYLVL